MKLKLTWILTLLCAASLMMACGSDDGGDGNTDVTMDGTTDTGDDTTNPDTSDDTTDPDTDDDTTDPDMTDPDMTDPDMTDPDMSAACDPVAQSGCDAGERCLVDTMTDTPACVAEAQTTVNPGDVCGTGGSDDCPTGYQCILVDGEMDPVCREICNINTGDGCSSGDEICSISTGGDGDYGWCGAAPDSCDPLDQNTCPEDGDACVVGRTSMNGPLISLCATAGAGEDGASCTGMPEECAAGFTCVGMGMGAGNCRQFCALDGDDCPMDYTCSMIGFTGDFANVGACIPNM